MNIIKVFLDLLYPPRCTFCRKLLKEGEEGMCANCGSTLPRLYAEGVRRDIKHVALCVFPFRYDAEVRESLHRFKFGAAAAYAVVYADFIAKSIDENGISCDIISWVPIHKRRMRERGYDQSELIAKALAEKLGLPCRRLLIKRKNNKRQSTLHSAQLRSKNVSGVYGLSANEELLGHKVLLVDDIVTTGASVSECASVLKSAGCAEVFAVAVASSV